MTKVAFICLGAYKISSWNEHQNFDRQSVYSIALHELLSLTERTEIKERELQLDLFVVDNTVVDQQEIIPELRDQFNHPRIQDILFINNNDLGSRNKGAGEYLMCRAVINKHKETLLHYDWIIYYTLRQIIISPLVLDAISNIEKGTFIKETNIIVGNPDYLYLDGEKVHSNPYCDMIFAMRPQQFFDYINSMCPEELVKKKMSSETNLHDFVEKATKKTGGKPLILEHLGVMRHNYAINKTEIV